jgi:chorismate mutase/prephenate dehydratase
VQESIENTAYAPKYILDKGDASIAAICSSSAAEQAGLVILEENACNTTCNQTRFIVVTRELIVTPDASRLSIIMQLPHKHGSLSSTLDVFTDKGLNLASICSQPVPDKPWEYAFFVDIDAPALDSAAICALCQLSYELPRLQIMGWYGSTTK